MEKINNFGIPVEKDIIYRDLKILLFDSSIIFNLLLFYFFICEYSSLHSFGRFLIYILCILLNILYIWVANGLKKIKGLHD